MLLKYKAHVLAYTFNRHDVALSNSLMRDINAPGRASVNLTFFIRKLTNLRSTNQQDFTCFPGS